MFEKRNFHHKATERICVCESQTESQQIFALIKLMKRLLLSLLTLVLGMACFIPAPASAYYYGGRYYRYHYRGHYYRYHYRGHYYLHRGGHPGYYRYW
jgi:hypothetical protein